MTAKRNASGDLLVGTWVGVDEWSTNIEYTIRRNKGRYSVTAIDTFDNEKPEIYEEKWDKKKGIFSFAGYWNSTGRFMRCRIQLTAKDKVEFTYTYTDSETMVRKKKPKTVQRTGASRSALKRNRPSSAAGSRR